MDLQTLSRAKQPGVDEGPPTTTEVRPVPPPRRRWATRLALPALVLLATLALIAYAMRDVIAPAVEVEVVRARAIGGQSTPRATEQSNTLSAPAPTAVVAQAPGWVEPDPYPIYATALTNGIVDKVHVLEGDAVKAGDLLVEMVDDDAALALDNAVAEMEGLVAEMTAAEAELKEPIALVRAEAVARASLAEAEAALTRLDAEVAQELAKLDELSAGYERLLAAGESSASAMRIEEAKYRMQSQAAVLKATRQRRPGLEARVEAAKAVLAAAERDLELKLELTRRRDEAVAAFKAGRARFAEAQLRVERMKIHSPIGGVVMERLVAPGAKLMLDMDAPHSAHAIHLYDPAQLQVRVDVPLADASKVGVGQRAVILVDVLPDTEFTGTVTRLVNRADIAKNTVQFKVAINNPSPLLKPDMLARVKFFGGDAAASIPSAGTPSGSSPVAIQRSAVIEGGDGPFVWWVSPDDSRLEQRRVTLGGNRGDGFIEVRSGLNPGDAVVNHPDASLQQGQRVRVNGSGVD